jgi:hypothetical protein
MFLWMSMAWAIAADPVEGVWDYVSYRPKDGEVIVLADVLGVAAPECELLHLALQLDPDVAWLIAESVCPVPATPDVDEKTVLKRCIAASKVGVQREGLELSHHSGFEVKAELHRLLIVTTEEEGGVTRINRKGKAHSCSVKGDLNGFAGTLQPLDDGTLQLVTKDGVLLFSRTSLRTHPL